jgi:hypothetical protein
VTQALWNGAGGDWVERTNEVDTWPGTREALVMPMVQEVAQQRVAAHGGQLDVTYRLSCARHLQETKEALCSFCFVFCFVQVTVQVAAHRQRESDIRLFAVAERHGDVVYYQSRCKQGQRLRHRAGHWLSLVIRM